MGRNAQRSTEKGHWHCDLMILTGNSKFKRALIMVEERSRFTHISFTTETFNEEEAEHLFEELKETIEANGNEIKSLRWDGESAIWDTAFKKWCNERQIRLDRSASGEQNLAESKIATLRERAKKIASSANKLPMKFESDVIRHACMVTNLLPNATLMGNTKPRISRSKPSKSIRKIKEVWINCIPSTAGTNDSTNKNESAKPHIFIGFDNLRSANYILHNPITKRNKIVHEATFVETTLTQNWYENLISGQEINYSGGDIDDISFTPLTFQEDGNEQNPETEMNDLPDLAPESEPEEESEEEYYESSDEEVDEQEISDNTQEINRP